MQYSAEHFKTSGQEKAKVSKLGLVNARYIIYKSAVKTDGTAQIYLQMRKATLQERIGTGLFIDPTAFDSARQLIKGKSAEVQKLNLVLKDKMSRVNEIIIDYSLRRSELTPRQLKNELENEGAKFSYLKYARVECEKMAKRGSITASTAKSEKESFNRIEKIQAEILFSDITPSWLEELESALRKRMKLKNSTIHKTIKHLRKYVNRARDHSGIRIDDPFKHYSLPTPNTGRIVWLTMAELTKIETLWHENTLSENLKERLRPMLFACHTGIRYSDYEQVQDKNIHHGNLIILPKKTERYQREIIVPLNAKAKAYLLPDKTLGKIHSDTYLSAAAKQVARMVGINKPLSTHVMRHTFASNWVLAGRNIVALQRLLGHAKLDETMRYVHLHATDLRDEMEKYAKWKG